MEPFGQRLRATREHGNMSVHTLAAQVGLTEEELSRIEEGSDPIEAHLLFDLAEALNISTYQLLQNTQAG